MSKKTDIKEVVFVSLNFHGENLDPYEVSELIPCTPYYCFMKGEKAPNNRIRGHNYLCINSKDFVKELDINEHINWLVGIISHNMEPIRDLVKTKNKKCRLSLFWIAPDKHIDFIIPPEAIRLMGDLFAELRLDIYSE